MRFAPSIDHQVVNFCTLREKPHRTNKTDWMNLFIVRNLTLNDLQHTFQFSASVFAVSFSPITLNECARDFYAFFSTQTLEQIAISFALTES